jgi:hypothetical protein
VNRVWSEPLWDNKGRLCFALLLATTSCATTYRVPKRQLPRIIQAFETREAVEVEADQGYGLEPVEMDDRDLGSPPNLNRLNFCRRDSAAFGERSAMDQELHRV